MKKKLMMLLLSLAMITTMMPAFAFATEESANDKATSNVVESEPAELAEGEASPAETEQEKVAHLTDNGGQTEKYDTLAEAITSWNGKAKDSGKFTLTIKGGEYTVNGLEIKQVEGNSLKIVAESGKTVKISKGSSGNIFTINAQSSFKGGAISFENIDFDLVGGAKAVSSISGNEKRYAHDITVKKCAFTNSAAAGTRAGYIFGADAGSSPRHFVVDECTANNINQVGSGYFYSEPIDDENPGITIKDTTLTGCKAVLNNQGAGSYSYLNNVTATDCYNPLLIQISGGTSPAKLDVVNCKLGSTSSTDNDKNKVGIITARYSDCEINITSTTFSHPNCNTLTDVWAYDRNNGSAGGYGTSKNSTSVKVTVNRLDNGGSVVLDGKTPSTTYRHSSGNEEGYGGGAIVENIKPVAKIGDTPYSTLAKAYAAAKTGDTIKLLVDEIDSISGIPAGVTLEGTSEKTVVKNSEAGLTGDLEDVTIKNIKFEGAGHAMYYCYAKGKLVTIEDCEFNCDAKYGIHFDEVQSDLLVKNCVIKGTVACSATSKNITFSGCTFAGRSNTSGYCNMNFYSDATFNNCTFSDDYTNGSKRGILMTDGENPSNSVVIYLNSCSLSNPDSQYELVDILRRDQLCVAVFDGKYGDDGKVQAGVVVQRNSLATSPLKLASGCKLAKIGSEAGGNATDFYFVGNGDNTKSNDNNELIGGKYAINPSAFIADGYYVKQSDSKQYPFEVVKKEAGEEPDQQQVVVEQKTETNVSSNITSKEKKEVAESALKKTEVTGVAEALTEKGQDDLVAKAVDTNDEFTQTAVDDAVLIDISITVKAEVKKVELDATKEVLAFEVKPYAVVTATADDGSSVSSEEVLVDNKFLARNAQNTILVQVGSDFEPEQVLHIKNSGVVETFKKGSSASYTNRTFTYSNKLVTLEITEFSEIKLLGTSEYADVSFDPGEGSGTMETVSVKKGESYTLPENAFTAPAGKKFDCWEIGTFTTVEKKPGESITVDDDTTVTAVWKDKGKSGGSGKGGSGTTGKKVKTGDENDPLLYLLLAVLAAELAAVIIRFRRKYML